MATTDDDLDGSLDGTANGTTGNDVPVATNWAAERARELGLARWPDVDEKFAVVVVPPELVGKRSES